MNINLVKNKIGKIFGVILFIFLFSPLVTFGQTQGGGTQGGDGGYRGIIPNCEGTECEFSHIMETIKYLVDFAVGIALTFSVVIIAYAGWMYMSSGDNPGQRAFANKMLLSVVKGIVLVLGAWLIVNLILRSLTGTGLDG